MAYPQYTDEPKSLSEALSTGLRRGIGNLLQNKMEALSQRNATRDLSARIQELGVPQQYANYFATLPHEYQVPLIQSYFQSQNQPLQVLPETGEFVPGAGQQFEQALQPQPQAAAQPQAQPQVNQIRQQLAQSKPAKEVAKEVFNTPFLDKEGRKQQEQMRREEVKRQEQLRKESIVEQHKADKETLPYYTQIKKENKGAQDNLKRLNRMEELIKKGNLPSAGWGSVLKTLSKGIFGFGLDLGFLTHADAQEFNKISQDFVRNAKDIFGARLTDADLNAFLQTVPTLSLTNEGKMRVVNNLRQANEAAKLRNEAMDLIIKSNNGKRPANLETLVEEVIAPELDILAERFKESNIPKVEEPYGLQLAGKIPHGLPPLF